MGRLVPTAAGRLNVMPFDPGDGAQKRFSGYGPSRLANSRDDEVDAFVADLVAGGPKAVALAISGVTEKARQVLRAYAERMASLAARRRDRSLLVNALVALVVGGLHENALESLMVMAPIEDSAHRLGVDLADVLEQASKIVGHPATVSLMMWLTRKPDDRSLASMGFIVGEDEDGFRYQLDW